MDTVGSKIVAEGADAYVSAMGNARDAHDKFVSGIESGAGKAGTSSKGMGEVITGALRAVGAMAVTALAEAGKALAQFGLDSIGAASDFEASMLRLKSVAGGEIGEAGLSLDDFRDKALQLGKDTKYSAGEAQEAMINLAKGGVPVKDVLGEASDAVLNLASAGEVELGPAAEIVAKQLGVWSSEGVTATQAADRLAQAANASTVDVDDLALGMANVGGVAKVAGVSFDDTVKTMALISPGFSSAADAGTSYKTFLNNLVPTTKKAKEMSQELGLTYFDTAKASETLKAAGIDASKMTEGQMVGALDKMSKKLGFTKKETEAFIGSFEKSKFYDAAGNFIGMSDAAQVLNDATKDLTVEQKALALETIFGADAQRAAAAIAEAGAGGFDKVTGAMSRAGTAAEQAAAKNQGFKFAQEQLSGSIETLQIIIGGMLLPILTQLFNDYLTPGVNTVMAFAEALGAAPDKIGFIQAAVSTLIPSMDGFGAIFQTVQGIVATAMPLISSIVASVLSFVSSLWTTHGADIMAAATTAWNSIKEIVNSVIGIVGAIVTAGLAFVNNYITVHMDEAKAIFATVWAAIKIVVQTAMTLIQGILKSILLLIQGDTKGALETMKTTFTTIWENIKTTVTTLIGQVKDVVQRKMDETKKQIDTVLDTIKTLFTTAWNAIVTGITNKVQEARNAAGALVDGIKSAIDSKVGAIKEALLGPIQAAVDGIRTAISGLWTAFNAIKSAVAAFRLPTLPGGSTGTTPPGVKASSVRATPSTASAGSNVSNSTSITKSFNMTVNTTQSSGSIRQDFGILQALAG